MSYGTVQAEKMTTESGYSLGAGNASSFKNRLINGAQVIDQRYAGAAYTSANGFVTDRWSTAYFAPNGGNYTSQQVADAPTGTGFKYSLRSTVTATPSSNADQYFQMFQPIEGYNIADLLLGTASAKSFTLSFWVKSSLTGTFCAAFTNNQSVTRSYIATYTIDAANTWEYKTITVQGDTSATGTWGTTNGQGLTVFFDLGSGTAQEASSAGSWQTGDFRRVSGAVRVVGTNGATFQVTGVQLEVGTVATSFDFRSYGTELALCQRYCYAFGDGYRYIGDFTNNVGGNAVNGYWFTFPSVMRATPTFSTNGATIAGSFGSGNQYMTPSAFTYTILRSGFAWETAGLLQTGNFLFTAEL